LTTDARLIMQFDSWQYAGLGRSMSESWFDICLGFYKEKDIINAQLCYRNGDWMIRKTMKNKMTCFSMTICVEVSDFSSKMRNNGSTPQSAAPITTSQKAGMRRLRAEKAGIAFALCMMNLPS